ncbi:MAG: hypothetical protein EON58_16375, partial [Alphaproteobacteria bacterium]
MSTAQLDSVHAGNGGAITSPAAWISSFGQAIAEGNFPRLRELFLVDSHWRDMGAFTWDLGSVSGINAIESLMRASIPEVRPFNFGLAAHLAAPAHALRLGREVIEVFYSFETLAGRGTGIVRLVETADGLKAWMLLTRLEGIRGSELFGPGRRPE